MRGETIRNLSFFSKASLKLVGGLEFMKIPSISLLLRALIKLEMESSSQYRLFSADCLILKIKGYSFSYITSNVAINS